jgi:hypothetical protein
MPTDQIVALLVAERDRLTRAIEALQGPTKRRGRPPKNPMASAEASSQPAATAGKRKGRTAAQRKAQAERMRAYWAARKRQKAKS